MNYLPKAPALAKSLSYFHPGIRITLCLNDIVPSWLDLDREPFTQIWTPFDLGYDSAWIFEHNVIELCTAVKGRALRRLLDSEDANLIAYLDPDVYLFHNLDPIEAYLGSDSIGLVPHILSPEETDLGVRLTEMSVAEHGIYNLGHLFVRPDANGRAFADWWASRLDRYCFDERERGLFTDQRWVDLVPAVFDGVQVLRQPNINVASWNLFGRTITQKDVASDCSTTTFEVDGEPLITYHFSGTGQSGSHRRIRETFDPGNGATAEIERIYEDAIACQEQAQFENLPFGFDHFENGEKITAELRKLYRRNGDLRRAFPDPFSCPTDKLCFLEWVRQNRPGVIGGYHVPTEMMQTAFMDLFDRDFYLSKYPEAEEAVSRGQYKSAVEHYCRIGSRMLCDPNEYFVSSYYFDRASSHDRYMMRRSLGAMSGTLLWHYLCVGLPNGIEPIEFFDTQWYLARNADLAAALRTRQISTPLAHFLRNGSAEGRNPGPSFIGKRYLEASPRARKMVGERQMRGPFGAFVKLGGVLGRAVV